MRRLPVLLLVLAACSLPRHRPGGYGIEALTFSGAGFRPVELDGYGTARGPHWPLRSAPPLIAEDVPEEYRLRGPPIAYRAGTRMEVALVARVPPDWSGTVTVRGGPFSGSGLAADGTVRAHVSAPAPPGSIEHWRIAWSASDGSSRVSLGMSSASLYILRAEPAEPLLHTPLSLASGEARVEEVWAPFAARAVRRARDGRQLKYYGEYRDGAPAELRRMLVSGTGQCVAWAYLLHAALGAHGIDAELVEVLPPPGGMLFMTPWRFIEGTRFISVGANGVLETRPAGDDVAYFETGRGVPQLRTWSRDPLPIGRLRGDDTLAYLVGRNGIAESFIDTAFALPLLARGFGLEMQPAFEVVGAARVAGDDVVRGGFVLTGPNGVLETGPQPGLRGLPRAVPDVQAALPRGWDLEVAHANWRAHVVAIGTGANGIIDSVPGGDDDVVMLDADYVSLFNMWPEPGERAQGNDRPPAAFSKHMLVRIGAQLYDPSYGTGPFADEREWERRHLAGVGVPLIRGGQVYRVGGEVAYAVNRRASPRYVRVEPVY